MDSMSWGLIMSRSTLCPMMPSMTNRGEESAVMELVPRMVMVPTEPGLMAAVEITTPAALP